MYGWESKLDFLNAKKILLIMLRVYKVFYVDCTEFVRARRYYDLIFKAWIHGYKVGVYGAESIEIWSELYDVIRKRHPNSVNLHDYQVCFFSREIRQVAFLQFSPGDTAAARIPKDCWACDLVVLDQMDYQLFKITKQENAYLIEEGMVVAKKTD